MKKIDLKNILIITTFFLFSSFSLGKTYKIYSTENIHNHLRLNTKTGEVKQLQDNGQEWIICKDIEENGKNEERFSLHKTQNMWNFLLLDNYTGRVWQIQFNVKGEEYIFSLPINLKKLAIPSKNSNWANRFELHQTQNMWNFILLDSYTGKTWQVQYSAENINYIGIVPIFDKELINFSQKLSNRFKLYKTTNMWNFILLDSYAGRLWQIQYSINDESVRALFNINEKELVDKKRKGSFDISPLASMYQYYLINSITGEIWKFQWSTKGDEYRWIEKLN